MYGVCTFFSFFSRTAFGKKFVGCPVVIDNTKYKRNALIFNVCFVLNQDTNTASYGPVVKKLAAYMIQLEVIIITELVGAVIPVCLILFLFFSQFKCLTVLR